MKSLIITAAGNSTRFGENKLLVDIKGLPLIVRTVRQFTQHKQIDEIVVATRAHEIADYQALFAAHQLAVTVVAGGKERIESLYQGLLASKGEVIITHDGARPFTPVWLIDHLLQAIEMHGAAMTAIAPTATIKYAEKDLMIRHSLARETTWIAQTPQGFTRAILQEALEFAIKEKIFVATDDSEIVALRGHKIKIVPGDPINMKVTLPSDLPIAREIAAQY